eukprot:TRINITY_DN18815_c0_g2_i2.p1 TRINITY_DN18815_c0_g2~~TRINITY_DN18815_c0_g2_i2.p1  ORF type:complete len:243 (-),score=49.44 TRINITY_DN18815_c0_g2_i2:172-900(-)
MSEAYRQNTKNVVLMKDDIGRAKKTTYDLPDEGHAYGRAEPADLEGAREITMHWAAHVPRPKPGPDCQDFKKINKLATKINISNAKQLAQFRKENDVKLIQAGPSGPLPKVIPSDVIPSFAYGRKSRPSTPIASVVGYQYCAEYEEALDMNYHKYDAMRAQAGGKHRVRLTKAAGQRISDARHSKSAAALSSSQDQKPAWKMKKFDKVGSRLPDEYKQKSRSLTSSNSMPLLAPDAPEMMSF